MSERDELVEVIDGSAIRLITGEDRLDAYHVADAILAAGYSKPRTIKTVEELDALPVGSVVRDAEDYVLERWGEPEDHMWATPMNGAWIRTAEVTLPATVLYLGGTK